MAAVFVIPINKGDWHLNLKFLRNFTQGILIHSWLSFWFSVRGIAGSSYVMLFWEPPACKILAYKNDTGKNKWCNQYYLQNNNIISQTLPIGITLHNIGIVSGAHRNSLPFIVNTFQLCSIATPTIFVFDNQLCTTDKRIYIKCFTFEKSSIVKVEPDVEILHEKLCYPHTFGGTKSQSFSPKLNLGDSLTIVSRA